MIRKPKKVKQTLFSSLAAIAAVALILPLSLVVVLMGIVQYIAMVALM